MYPDAAGNSHYTSKSEFVMTVLSLENNQLQKTPVLRRHLNKVRWLVLSLIILTLILLPFLHLYQTYLASHAYDLLEQGDKQIYITMEALTAPFTNNPDSDLDKLKGNTWSGTLFGIKLSDPLAVVGQVAASFTLFWPFLLTALIPIIVTLVFGRVYCGWICPATLIYELTDNLGTFLHKAGLPISQRRLNPKFKYLVLAVGMIFSMAAGAAVFANIYPPAIIGRELYYAIALGGIGAGSAFLLLTIGFDLFVARRGFCRYLCPGGALYSILGRYRLVRIKRDVTNCNDCAKCNTVCQFDLDPMRDNFSQECNNCTACMAVCPTDTLQFTIKTADVPFQGPGHLGQKYRKLYTNQPLENR